MKGHFHLRADPYTDQLHFCNLHEDMSSLGSMSDALRGDGIGRLIAHDVVEHSLAHRKKSYVTFEDEIRAIGAVGFVRGSEGFDLYSELYDQCKYCHRDIKPVPYTIGKFLLENDWISADKMRYLIQNGITPSNARNAVYQCAWGEYQKTQQFDSNDYLARNAFNFIESNIADVIREISLNESWGASIFFDTVKHIFRYRMKWGY